MIIIIVVITQNNCYDSNSNIYNDNKKQKHILRASQI